jgi:hypothetical protein
MQFRDESNKGTAQNFVQISEKVRWWESETLAKITPSFGEENMSRTRKFQTHRDCKKARQLKSKAKSMLIIYFDMKVIVHKEFVLAGQSIRNTTVTFTTAVA